MLPTSLAQLRRYRAFRRMLASFAAVAVLAVTLCSLFLSFLYARFSMERSGQLTAQMLGQLSFSTQVVWEQMQAVYNALSEAPEVVAFVNLKRDDKVASYLALRQLGAYKALYGYLKNISVVNHETRLQVNCVGTVSDIQFALDYARAHGVARVPRNTYPNLGERRSAPVPVLSLIYPLTRAQESAPYASVILDVDAAHLKNMLSDTAEGNELMLLDGQGRVIAHTGGLELLTPLDGQAFVRRALGGPETSGSFFERVEGVNSQVSYHHLPEMDWTILALQPVSQLLGAFRAPLLGTGLAALLTALISLLLAALLARSLYRPVKGLLDRITHSRPSSGALDEYRLLAEAFCHVERQNRDMRASLEQLFLRGLLLGEALEAHFSEQALEQLSSGLQGAGSYQVVVFRPLAGADAPADALCRFALGNIAQEMLGGCGKLRVTELAGDVVALLLNGEASSGPPSVLEEVGLTMREQFGVEVAAGVGEAVAALTQVEESYRQAVGAMERQAAGRAQLRNQRLVRQAMELLEDHCADPDLSLQRVADWVGLSPSYLGRLFKAARGETLGDCLTRLRLERACQLLRATGHPVSQIAQQVGLCNAAYFATLFKKAYGQTPSQYREQFRGASD